MKKLWYIKARHNPQLIHTYYVACGQLTKKEAKAKAKTLYGHNYMLEFQSEQEYKDKISELKIDGFEVEEWYSKK